MQTVLDLLVAADQCGGVLLGKQIEPLRMAGFFACCELGDDVDESLQMQPVMDIDEILRHASTVVFLQYFVQFDQLAPSEGFFVEHRRDSGFCLVRL